MQMMCPFNNNSTPCKFTDASNLKKKQFKLKNPKYVTSNNEIVNNDFSFGCIPRYFVAEGYMTLDYTGKNIQIGICLLPFLNITPGSIVYIERCKNKLFIKSYYNQNYDFKETAKLLKKYVDSFNKYPNDGVYKEQTYEFKLMMTLV